MPFEIPLLRDMRRLARDAMTAKLPGSELAPPNSRLRFLTDNNAAVAHLNLLYLEWISRQMLPDTAEGEWLDRHGSIWGIARKAATFAEGLINLTGSAGSTLPSGSRFSFGEFLYQTTAEVTLASEATPVAVEALTAGAIGNQDPGTSLSLLDPAAGVDGVAIVVALTGGTDEENDDDLRVRVLERIQQPPMGGDAADYVAWAKEVPGVTRVWVSPLEMGPGTVTVRFMMDDLRADNAGFPLQEDIDAVREHLDEKRPVAVKDFFVESPIPEPISFQLDNMVSDDAATRAEIIESVTAMLTDRAAPAFAVNGVRQDAVTIWSAWISEAVSKAIGVEHFDLTMSDHPMPSAGHMAVLGTIAFAS